ncbi:LysR family transcriptional regulator [Hahella aquimaris]|uniref:LysR family transcriptional regulator n=1 Tax=Hahella sp. HNIBRBA332 TaxID=3015983 RepID=UPI00273C05FE|nr:LysR family transcriptional regulator [Hahella sp. HNIBRBA332]WLQ17060.1 LysR family transcriptional regulator [Hahella sp. HNIBRBA332]
MDKLRALRFFDHVGKTGSFSDTARYFDIPVSSVTRQIQALEEELGARLLHRTTRVVKLTEIGEIYLQHCSQILRSLDNADELIANYRSTPSGVLRISCSPSYGESRIVPILPEFEALYPEIIIDIDLTDKVVDIMRDTVDIAVRAGQIPDERVVAKYIDDNNFSLAASDAYLSRYGTPRQIEDLSEHRAIFFRTSEQVLYWQANINGRWRQVDIRPALITSSPRLLRQWASEGKGLAMMPNWALRSGALPAGFHILELDYPLHVSRATQLGIYLLYQRPKYAVPKVKAAVDFLVSRLAQD